MDDRYRRIARIMLRDGQIWFLYDWTGFDLHVRDSVVDKVWDGLEREAMMASQSNFDPGVPNTPGYVIAPDSKPYRRPELLRFNRDFVLWVQADQE